MVCQLILILALGGFIPVTGQCETVAVHSSTASDITIPYSANPTETALSAIWRGGDANLLSATQSGPRITVNAGAVGQDDTGAFTESVSYVMDSGLLLGAFVVGIVLILIISAYTIYLARQVKRRALALAESESRLRQLAENIREVFFLISPDWRKVYYISPAYEIVWQRSCDSLYANPLSWLDSIHPDDRSQVEEDVREKSTGALANPAFREYRVIRPDKTVRWIMARVYPIHDHQGKIYRIAGIAEDITERKKLDVDLLASKRMLQLILDTIPTRVFWKDRDSVYLGCNRLFANDAGLATPSEIIGKTDFDFNWAKQADAYRADDHKVINTGQAKLAYEEPQTTPDGRLIWLETSKIPLTDIDGRIIGMLGTYNDITARKQAEIALSKSRAEFQAIFNSITDAVIFADISRRIVMINPAVTDIFGYTLDELAGQSTEILYASKQAYQEQGKQRFTSDARITEPLYETQYRRANGEVFTGETLGTQVKDEQGNVFGFVALIRDVSERTETLKALQASEARYQTLTAIVPVGIFRADPEGRCIYVNERWCEMAGMTMNDALGEGWQRALHPDDRERVLNDWQTGHTQKGMFQSEYRFRRPDGVVTWLLGQICAEYDVEDNPLGYVGTITDISDMRKAQDVQRRLAGIFDASVNEIYMFAMDTLKFTLVNQAALNNLGYSLAEMQQLTPVDIKPVYDEQQFRQLIGPLYSDKTSLLVFETIHQRKNGSRYPVEVRLQKLPSDVNPVFMAIILDISERKQAEDQLRKLNVELEERVRERTARLANLNKEMEAFSYSVSHDLRAPLRAIDGFSNALEEDYTDLLDDNARSYLSRIRKAAQRMSVLIDDLLKLSRLTQNELEWRTVDLGQLAVNAIERNREAEPGRNVEVSVQPDLLVKGDFQLLQILMDNLLDNAFKYTRKSNQARIEVGRQQLDGEVVFYIKDNGVGFDMQYADKLFGAFQRLHSMDEYEGSGIGLATVQRIVNRHGGRIWAESTPGAGSCFYFVI